jgi:hypothetical protein
MGVIRTYSRPIVIFILATMAYSLLASRTVFFQHSSTPYPIALADAFLHGRLDLVDPPSGGYDLIFYRDHWYVAQQPLPSLLIVPFVAVFGAAHVSDILVDIFLGACSVTLCDVVLGITAPEISLTRRGLLTIFFALGTVHAWLSILGTNWFLGQISAMPFCWLFIYMVWKKRPILSGIMLGIVLLGRPSIVPGAFIWAIGWWSITGLKIQLPKQFVQLAIPVLIAAVLLGEYNYLRFGNPGDFGYQYLNDAPNIRNRRLAHGSFNPTFLPENLMILTVKPPEIHLNLSDLQGFNVNPTPEGMGFLWISPVLLYAIVVFPKTHDEKMQYWWLVTTVLLIMLPSLLYHNTGSAQFGYRFILDALPFWMILVAWGAKYGSVYLLASLVFFSVTVNVWGTRWFYRFWYRLS